MEVHERTADKYVRELAYEFARRQIKENPNSYLRMKPEGIWPRDSHKCTPFTYDMFSKAGAQFPLDTKITSESWRDWLPSAFQFAYDGKYLPTQAKEFSDKNTVIPDWPTIGIQYPELGDRIVQYPELGDLVGTGKHVGIYSGNGKMISASADGITEKTIQAGATQPTYRRYQRGKR